MTTAAERARPYEFLEHTADAKFRAFGRTLEEAFENAARAVISLMWDASRVSRAEAVEVEIAGRDRPRLLVNFLEEILYLLDARSFLSAEVESTRIEEVPEGLRLRCRFLGDSFREEVPILGEVKAVTYSEMEITEGDGFSVQVVVDL